MMPVTMRQGPIVFAHRGGGIRELCRKIVTRNQLPLLFLSS